MLSKPSKTFRDTPLIRHFKLPLVVFWGGLVLFGGLGLYQSPYSTFQSHSGYSNYKYLSLFFGLCIFMCIGLISRVNPIKRFLEKRPNLGFYFLMFSLAITFSYGISTEINIIFDRGAAQRIDVTVEKKIKVTGRGGHEDLLLNSAQLNPPQQTLSVGSKFFDHVQVGDELSISVHPGALGLLWFDGSWEKAKSKENL